MLHVVAFTPVRRTAVSDQVFTQLRDAIVTGAFAPGEALPPERVLAEECGVNRHAVREALKRLQQVRLVEVSHGGATRVLDWHEHAGLDLVVQLAEAGPESAGGGLPVPHLVRDMMEMRVAIGADAARLCALRGAPDVCARIVELAAVYRPELAELDELGELDQRFWRAIVRGSGNVGYLLAFNSLVGHALQITPVPRELRAAELLDAQAHQLLAEHIVAGSCDAAARCARDLLSRSVATAGE